MAWDNIPYTPALEGLAKQTTAVCFGSLAQRSVVSRETINKFLDAMPEDTLKVFDINLRQGFYTKEVLCNSFQKCNVLKINDEELVTVSRMFGYPGIDLQDKCWILLAKYNLKMLILTCGVNGSYVFTPGNVSFVETPKVNVADTVGAGDSFTATFVASILKGKTVREAHELAVEASAFVCTQNGAMPEFPLYLKEKNLSYIVYLVKKSPEVCFCTSGDFFCLIRFGSLLKIMTLRLCLFYCFPRENHTFPEAKT